MFRQLLKAIFVQQSELFLRNSRDLVMQMLHEWIGERFEQLSSFLTIIFLSPDENLVHILLQYVHSSVESLMLFPVVSHIQFGLEKRKNNRFFAMVVVMDRGQETQRVSSECVLVFGFHKGIMS